MKTTWKILLPALFPVAFATGHARVAEAQVVVYPPPAYVASYTPIYYGGFAHYYYNNHFYYRDHGAWHGYAHEPAALWGQRGQWASHRHAWR